MATGPKHGLVGQLKGTLRYERCQEHLSKRTVPLSKRDERDRRSDASETSVIAQVAHEGSSGRLRGCYGGRGECVDYLGLVSDVANAGEWPSQGSVSIGRGSMKCYTIGVAITCIPWS